LRCAESMLTLSADMDESSSLLDLLECSVCLERLDTTAKVLPCQHTFCRRCLENIVSSRNELRCPECRILVDCGVDDLPANILLVRLLDGIKQRPLRGSGGGGVGAGGRQPLAGGSLQGYAAGISASPPGSGIRELPIATRSSPVKNLPALPCGKALYSYEGKEPGDLQFAKGDIIILRRKVDDNWYHGELNGCHGFLPASYIQLLRPLSQTPPQGKALYDFEVKDKDQDKDCLAFSKDEVLTVIRRVDDNWAEGMLGDKIGIFPILYVELNETAKQLMEIDKPTPAPVPGPSSEPAPLGPCSPGPSPSASPSNGNDSGHRRGEGKKNAKKRHSFTALSVSQRAAQLNNRHSMEISHPVLISSSDPRAAARIQVHSYIHTHTVIKYMYTVPQYMSQCHSPLKSDYYPPPSQASRVCSALINWQGHRYLALYAYKPQKADELELRKGEMYRVTEKCQDGWFKGTSLRTAASGVFPGNYVTPVSRKAGGLLKLLSGAAAKKKPRSPPSSPPTHDPSLAGPGAVATDPAHHPHHHHHHARSGSCPMASQGRAGSCPIESEMAGAMGLEPLHRKSGSLDTNFPLSPPATRSFQCFHSSLLLRVTCVYGRYRVVVPYPPQSEAEIELREGDVVFVHKKREDGWYKGTLQRTGRTGLFPGSFVESF
uniref:RING-type E3 ubiquitin transferase n=1 Tax=Myripristis murdjan TaxID=586833 RepID=A0A667Z4M6_9TELE